MPKGYQRGSDSDRERSFPTGNLHLGSAHHTHIDTCTYMRTYNIGTIHVVFDIYIIYIQCPTYIIHFKIYVHIYVYVYTYMYTHMKFFFHLGKEGAV